jgi:PHD/YefM family antitoxin component YafN of YafNO toxin-antitoxin module
VKRVFVLVLALAAGCSDALEQTSSAGQVVAVVNSAAPSVSLISATDWSVTTLTLAASSSVTPRSIGGRGTILAVPLGDSAAVAIADLERSQSSSWRLPGGSGATGVAIQDDSILWIANPNLNTVTRVNYLTGDTTSIPVGVYPQAVAIVRGRVFVANGNLVNSTPAGPSWLTSFACCVASTTDSIPLTGTNARFLAVGDDSLLYVITSGSPGRADGRLSIVEPVERSELVVINGLGESPGAAAFHPSGRLLVSSTVEGILEINTLTRWMTRGPGRGVKPGGDGVSALAVDLRGRVYAASPRGCVSPGVLHVLSAPPDYRELRPVVIVGTCPVAAALATTP